MNVISCLILIMFPAMAAGWLPVPAEPGCADPPAEAGRSPAERAVCGIADWNPWITDLPPAWHGAVEEAAPSEVFDPFRLSMTRRRQAGAASPFHRR